MARLSDDVWALFEAPNFAHVATVMADGSPHTVLAWIGLEGGVSLLYPGGVAEGQESRARPALRDLDHRLHEFVPLGVGARPCVETLDGEAALEVIDRLAPRYTREPSPMRSSVVFLVEPERTGVVELPFRHTPRG